MGTIFSSSPEKKLFLYSCGSSIYFRTAVQADITRPIVLCNDFSNSLSSAIFQDIIYYSYQNTDGDLILRNVLDTNVIYNLPSKESPGYFSPLLLPFDDDILFLFFVKNPLSEQYLLKYTHPFDPLHTIHDIHTFSSLPVIHWIPLGNEILLSCHTLTESFLFKFENKNHFQTILLISVHEELYFVNC